MNSLEKNPLFSAVLLVIGLLLVNGGIKIIRNKRFLVVSRYPSSPSWHKPFAITGNKAIFFGICYVFTGILIIIVSITFYSAAW
jgi:hypothetical protein